MKTITLSDQDADQVKAILLTTAEMQDNRSMESMQVRGRLKKDEPEDAADMIDELDAQISVFEDDCENLKRIANLF